MNTDLSAIERLDRVIHEKARLGIMSLLATADSLTFTELRDFLKLTDGNLSVHLRTLEESAFVTISKSFVGRRPQTRVALTNEGRQAFQEYIETLASIVRRNTGETAES